MKKIYNSSCGPSIKCTIYTKIICTLKELKFFFTKALWNKKYRYFNNSLKLEFIECFDPLTWE